MKNLNIITIHREYKCQRKSAVHLGQLNIHFSVKLLYKKILDTMKNYFGEIYL